MSNIDLSNSNVINSEVTLDEQEQLPIIPVSQLKLQLQWSALLEIVAFLGALFLVDYFLLDGTRYRQFELHPFWIIVLLVSVQYGTRMGVISALAASVVLLIGNVPEQALEQNMYQWFFTVFKLPILWVATSVIIGELSARRTRELRHLSEELASFASREETLLKSFNKIKSIKEKLEIHIAGQRRTVRKTLKAAMDMDHLEPMQVLEQAQNLIVSMLEPDKFSIYLLKDNQLQIAFEHGWSGSDNFIRSFSAESQLFKSVVQDWNTLCIAKPSDEIILTGQGILAGPLIIPKTGEFFGMLKLEKHSFSRLSINSVKDFNSICKWIGAIYGKAVNN